MDNSPKKPRPLLSLANASKIKKKESDEKEKESTKDHTRKTQAENHYTQTLRKALSEVIGIAYIR